MLYTYPSNRMENLVFALDQLLSASKKDVFTADTILVQHPGMQHWLSMELAKLPTRQLCMNVKYPLPVRYFWDLIRYVIGPDKVPDRSAYSREILTWRIYLLLTSEPIANHPSMAEPTNYWKNQTIHLQDNRRFQLSQQLADLFEQYLMFRPEWINSWENGEPARGNSEQWQAILWRALVAEDPNHPLALMRRAEQTLKAPVQRLPETFYIFGINALAPIWLEFLNQVAEQADVDIHLLYLNPSAEYWDDIKSEKQIFKLQAKMAAKSRATWLQSAEDSNTLNALNLNVGNPLLSSLGQQGQAFVRLLSDQAHFDTHVFSQNPNDTSLHRLQNDILTLTDARATEPNTSIDGSICITSAHSAFREVQGLHDWLLHQFNNDPSLTPKDVLVMCPNVEDYAPYVQAVFARSFADIKDTVPPLPCSIADRNLKDADPTVAAFLELLSLPDARFEVNQILSWLRVPAIAHKFTLSAENIQSISRWLDHANVHWGLDANHKHLWVEGQTSDHFTWKQGLDRLLLGFAYSDEEIYTSEQVLLPDVEGSDAVLLGKLALIIEQLQNVRSQINKHRTPSEWQQYLIDQLQIALISTDSEFERSNQSLLNAINDFTEFANRGGLAETPISLSVVRSVLENTFASPEQTGNQFMTGQITVCSMVPMRSIPFKVIAIVGLNDGQFPRTRPPLGFDLMAKDTPKLGDRSRRGDDRYLFLESILSARQALYLSYQGFDIRKNEPKPPSLVLEELLDYLSNSYGFDKDKHVRQLPLQPFSPRNYRGEFKSFDANWIKLNQSTAKRAQTYPLAPINELKTEWHLSEWIRFLDHPSKYFAQQRLGLFLDQVNRTQLEDREPFSMSHLDRYTLQAHTIEQNIHATKDVDWLAFKKANSELPTHRFVDEIAEQWTAQADEFSQAIVELGGKTIEVEHRVVDFNRFTLTADLPISSQGILYWRLATAKGKDIINLWLYHLIANLNQPTTSKACFRGKAGSFELIECSPLSTPKRLLEQFHNIICQGHNEPLLLNSAFIVALLKDKASDKDLMNLWRGGYMNQGMLDDPYIQMFWPDLPNFDSVINNIEQYYQPLIECTSIRELSEEEINA